jgi:hypothetical protein
MVRLTGVFQFIIRNINFKMGFVGAFVMGGFVYWLNGDYGFQVAIIPAFKQFIYTFLIGGSLVRLAENLSLSYESSAKSIFLSVLVATAITAVLLTVVHLIRGTPRPFYTIFWTALIAPPGFFIIALRKRRKHNREYDKE